MNYPLVFSYAVPCDKNNFRQLCLILAGKSFLLNSLQFDKTDSSGFSTHEIDTGIMMVIASFIILGF